MNKLKKQLEDMGAFLEVEKLKERELDKICGLDLRHVACSGVAPPYQVEDNDRKEQ